MKPECACANGACLNLEPKIVKHMYSMGKEQRKRLYKQKNRSKRNGRLERLKKAVDSKDADIKRLPITQSC